MNPKRKKILVWIGLTVASFAILHLLQGAWFAFIIMFMIGLHESGHLLAAKYVGAKTRGFYFLPMFGGASFIEMPSDQWKKYIIAYGGPLMGLVLCVLAVGVLLVGRFNIFGFHPEVCQKITEMSSLTILVWSTINIFNLLPIYPLDGGRLLASIHVNGKNNFPKYIFHISWGFMILTGILTQSLIVVGMALILFRFIGQLEKIMLLKIRSKQKTLPSVGYCILVSFPL